MSNSGRHDGDARQRRDRTETRASSTIRTPSTSNAPTPATVAFGSRRAQLPRSPAGPDGDAGQPEPVVRPRRRVLDRRGARPAGRARRYLPTFILRGLANLNICFGIGLSCPSEGTADIVTGGASNLVWPSWALRHPAPRWRYSTSRPTRSTPRSPDCAGRRTPCPGHVVDVSSREQVARRRRAGADDEFGQC